VFEAPSGRLDSVAAWAVPNRQPSPTAPGRCAPQPRRAQAVSRVRAARRRWSGRRPPGTASPAGTRRAAA